MNAARSAISLRCALGWHAPEQTPRWNDGYYFARCRRCGCDLVRTSFGQWHVPRGYRVVWSAVRPEGAATAALEPAPPAEAQDRPAGELPIQEVLRHMQEQEAAAPPVPAGHRTFVPDFMDDPAADTDWRNVRPLPPVAPAPPPARPLADLRRRLPDMGRVRAALGRAFEADRRDWFQRFYIGLLALLVLLLFWMLLMQDRAPSPAEGNANVAAPEESWPDGQPAYVTASVLNCRSAPAEEAPPLDRLVRGDQVIVLARDAEWASLSHQGGQCWALVRYLALQPPL